MQQQKKLSFALCLMLYFLLGLGGMACETVSDDPVFNLSPSIELVELSADTLVQFQDQLSVRISYEDGDGDIGNEDPDVNTIFVKDARLETSEPYYVAPIAPVGSNVSITGTLNLMLSKTFVLGNADQETTTFDIYLIDQAGNQSNTIQTTPITIIRE